MLALSHLGGQENKYFYDDGYLEFISVIHRGIDRGKCTYAGWPSSMKKDKFLVETAESSTTVFSSAS